MEEEVIKKAEILVEALPYIQKYQGKYFVIKIGGAIIKNLDSKAHILTDIAFLKLVGIKCIVVCGGGPFINEEIIKRGKKPVFVDGLRVTDKETLDIARESLSEIKNEIVNFLQHNMKIKTLGLEPEENCIVAKKIHYQKGAEVIDLGFVGQVEEIDGDSLKNKFLENGVIVIYPMAYGKDGCLYNINADSVASSIAGEIGAEKLIILTNVLGVMRNPENPDTLISILETSQLESLIEKNTIKEGMLPKAKSAILALKKGVEKVHIISGNIPHSIILEVFTDKGIGTEIV